MDTVLSHTILVSDQLYDNEIADQCEALGYKPLLYSERFNYLLGFKANWREVFVTCFRLDKAPEIIGRYPNGQVYASELLESYEGFLLSTKNGFQFFRCQGGQWANLMF